MNKEDITFGIGGIVLGAVLGFLIANWLPATGSQQDTASTGTTQQLPPGHPDIGAGGQPGQQLPPGHPQTGQAPPGEAVELPSLEPLPAQSSEKRTEQQYKNIQVLKGLPADRLMGIMLSFKSALGVDCSYCHVQDNWDRDDKPAKQTARRMIAMTRDINSKYVSGIGRVSCYTCHRGQQKPPA